MSSKYVKDKHTTDIVYPYKGSAVWRRMLQTRPLVEEHICWIIGQGHLDALKDSWLQRTCSYPHRMQVKDMFQNNYSNEVLIKNVMGDDAWKEILDKNICLIPLPGALIWKPSSCGRFSISSAWKITRQREGIFFGKMLLE